MGNLDEVTQEFKTFSKKIQRLKQLELELNALNIEGFETEASSIRSKLKKPQAVDEVEEEMTALKKKVKAKDTVTGTTLPRDISTKYETLGLIGFGGFADVYKARKKDDGRLVALKIPRISLLQTVEPKVFLEEANLWSRLKHPNIVEVIEYGSKPYPWIAMEYMENGSLRLKIGNLAFEESIDIAIKVCDALYYTHHLGIIHRDIKPENILIDKTNNPKLADWGLGKMMIEHSMMSGSTGTPAYSSPEQIKPSEFGESGWWTDIYQCGAVLYEMVTGQLPFKGTNPLELALKITTSDVLKPSEIKPSLPKEFDDIITTCLAKDKDKRYKDISMMKVALENIRSTSK